MAQDLPVNPGFIVETLKVSEGDELGKIVVSRYVFSQELSRNGKYTLECNSDILKTDGTSVCEIRKAVVDIYSGCPDIKDQADLVATKKISFKEAVKPGEELLIHLTVSGIQ